MLKHLRKNFNTLFAVAVILLIVCCLFFGCCDFDIEGLEASNNPCIQSEPDQKMCESVNKALRKERETDQDICVWSSDDVYKDGRCERALSENNCVNYYSKEDCPSDNCAWVEGDKYPNDGYCAYNKA